MMYNLYEQESLDNPIECFYFDSTKNRFPVPPHWHYFAEMIFVVSGKVTIRLEDAQYTLSEGEMFFVHPKTVHSFFYADLERPDEKIILGGVKFDLNKVNLIPVYAPKMRNIFRLGATENMPVYFDREVSKKLDAERLFLDCIHEMRVQQYGFDLKIRTNVSVLLLNILRYWMTEKGFVIGSDIYDEENQHDIESITEYIDSHLKDKFQISDLAKECGLSYSCFAKKFKELYAVSCKEYVEKLRIYKVEEYLLFTSFDLNYISQETGFADCSHMIKSFKKYRGYTPKQFRMNNKRRTTP